MNVRAAQVHPEAILHGILAVALFASLFTWSLSSLTATAGAQSTPPAAQPSLADVVERVAPAVVTVYNLDVLEGIGALSEEDEAIQQGVGSGFIIDEEGHVVTNWHVTTGGDAYAVQFADGTTVEAELIGEDPRDDLAVVKIDPEAVPATVAFGDSEALRPGDPVFAIGTPLGAFANTVTEGIVGGLGRDQLNSSEGYCQNYADLIQHDAAINPGNSGGPLFNMAGEVIGVNTLGLPTDASGLPVQGLFFAVPGNLVKEVAQELIETGELSSPYLGISTSPNDPAVAASEDLSVDEGAFVAEVFDGSPADEAGLEAGDVVVAIDGSEITQNQTLGDIILSREPGDDITLSVVRGDEEIEIGLTVGEVPESELDDCVLQQG